MRIRCNRSGGINLKIVKLKNGENTVDAKAWAKAVKSVPPQWIKAMTTGDPPTIEVLDDIKTPACPVLGDLSADLTRPDPTDLLDDLPVSEIYSTGYSAKQAVAEIQSIATLGELHAFVRDDTRRMVVKAVRKRRSDLGGWEDNG